MALITRGLTEAQESSKQPSFGVKIGEPVADAVRVRETFKWRCGWKGSLHILDSVVGRSTTKSRIELVAPTSHLRMRLPAVGSSGTANSSAAIPSKYESVAS
jgi:hypothetical protein